MCPFNYEEEALALVTEGALKVGTVEAIEKLHIKKIPLGESARRIAHQEESRTFGVLTVKNVYNENTGEEEEQSFLKILDDRSFDGTCELTMMSSVSCADCPNFSSSGRVPNGCARACPIDIVGKIRRGPNGLLLRWYSIRSPFGRRTYKRSNTSFRGERRSKIASGL